MDDWINAYLPGEDLPDNLQWTPFNVDLTSEVAMYPGLNEGLQNVIETAECHGLAARWTNRYPDNIRWSRICPDLGIYPAPRPNPDVQDSSAASVDPIELLRARYNTMEVLVEVKHEDEMMECTTPSPTEGDAAGPLGLQEYWEQMGDYVTELANRQHRLFVFMILFVNDKAWLLRFDRTGSSTSPEFDYIQHPEIIGKFLYRLSRQSGDARGYDPTAVPASQADAELFRNLHTRYNCESAVARGLADAAMDGWQIYKLTIEGQFTPDDNRAVLPNDPVSRREFLIGKPMTASRSFGGRGTKVHVAYDIATKKIVVIKDSWRPNSRTIRSEYDTYLLLNAIDAEETTIDIPTLLGGGDVVYQGATQETRTSNPDLLTRIHFRLVLKEVCRPLEDFEDSLELVTAIEFALGAHFVAWTAAHVLHRDVSVGNILILDEDPEKPPNPKNSKGLLADWDLAKTRDEVDNPVFTQKTRSGTWPFISARLQHTGPEQHHELSDDLESFVHVLNYCAVKFLPNKLSKDNVRLARFISNVYDYVRESGGLDKGSHEKLELLVGNKPFVELENPNHPLTSLLQALSELCWQHYHYIQFPPPTSFHPPSGRKPEGLVSSPLKRLVQQSSVPLRRAGPPTTPARTLPVPNPDQSPLKDHNAIAQAFVQATDASSNVEWPSDKVKRAKPLVLPVAASRTTSGKRQSGAPLYASYGVEEPRFSTPGPAKRARTGTTTDSRGSQDSRDSRGRASGSVPAKAPKTSSRRRTRPEKSPARFIDPMSMRSGGESSRSRSTTPESQGVFGDAEDDLDMDVPEPGTHESGDQAAVSARGHHYAERISDMAAGLDDMQFD